MKIKRQIQLVVSLFVAGLGCGAAPAASLMLDFGPTVPAATNNTLSMGHFSGAIPATETSWNVITADNSNLVFSDGTAATGVSVDMGRSDSGISNIINFNNNAITSSALGGSFNTGIYIGSSPVRDGVFATAATGGTTINTNALGLRINGLAAGAYTIYISGRNTSTGVSAAQRFFCQNGAAATSFAFSTNASTWVDEINSATPPGVGLPNAADGISSTFAYGDNCALMTVTLNAGDSLFLAAIGTATNELRGFLNAVQIVPGAAVLTNFAPVIGKQPTGATVYEGATVSITNVTYAGLPVLSYQWINGTNNVPGATNKTLVLSNVLAGMAGNYAVVVSNSVGQTTSSVAAISITPLFNTGQMTNIWNLLPGDRFYITVTNTTSGERGIAYNPITSNLLVDCQLPSNNLVVLSGATGAEQYFMNLTGVPVGAAGLNMVGVADDGAVYGENATANAGSASTPYILWRWPSDAAGVPPTQVLSGDPGFGTSAIGLRWGDNIAVRGAGANTQILIAPGTGSNVCLFTTADGINFSPNILTVTGVPSGFAQFGVAFGTGGNTFWAKTVNQSLYLIQFDLGALTGTVLNAYTSSNGVPNTFRLISTSPNQNWLAGIMSVSSGLSDNVRLYSISNLVAGPVLADQELYTTQNANTFLNGAGTGSTIFGGNFLFALDSQNGIKAFLIDPNFIAGLSPFSITGITTVGSSNVLTWPSVVGHAYQMQSKTNLTDAAWTNTGSSITASGTNSSFTNAIGTGAQFYRVRGQ